MANVPFQPPTFSTVNGTANVDVTLASPAVGTTLSQWRVLVDCMSSDHRVITFELGPPPHEAQPESRFPRFNLKRANWDRFVEVVEDSLRHTFPRTRSPDEVSDLAVLLQSAILTGAEIATP